MTSQFDFDMIKEIYRNLARVIEFNMLTDLKTEEQTTSSLSIIMYDGEDLPEKRLEEKLRM